MFDLWFQPSDELKGALLTWVAELLHDQPIETFYSSEKLYKDTLRMTYHSLMGCYPVSTFDDNYFRMVSLLHKEVTTTIELLGLSGYFIIGGITELTAKNISIKMVKIQ